MHLYKNNKGENVPSVTTVLKVINKDGLVQWANMLGFKHVSYNTELNKTAIIGTMTHELVESYLTKSESQIFPFSDDIVKEANKRFNIFKEYIESNNLNLTDIEVEQNFVSEYFGGTIDCLANVNGIYTLIDFKTSKKIYDSHFIQLGGYLLLLYLTNKDIFDKIENCMIFAITDSKVITKTIPKSKMLKYSNVFIYTYKLYMGLQAITENS